MTVFTLVVVLVATTASALTMTLVQTMTKRLVRSETKALRKQLHEAQLKLQYTTEYYEEKVESAVRIARDAIKARDYYKSFVPLPYSLKAKNAEKDAEMKRRIREKIHKARGR